MAKKKDTEASSDGGQPFEEMLQRLRETVDKLEGGQLNLEESLQVFEEGMKLQRLCTERLDAAERRIEKLLGVDPEGPRTEPFEVPEG